MGIALDVLIVEDDILLNDVMSLQLVLNGLSVRSAHGGMSALKMIAETVPSLLVLDVGLGDISGFELVAELRLDPATCMLPLIVHTSLDLTPEQQSKMTLGPTSFVTKNTAYSDDLPKLVRMILATP